jgi:mercuric reductase
MLDCFSTAETEMPSGPERFAREPEGKKLIILGGGGAAFAAALKASSLGAKVTIINDRLPMGGTCVNVGCVPSKTLLRGAEALHRAMRAPAFAGISTTGRLTDFAALMRQKRELVEELRATKYADVIRDDSNIIFRHGRGRFLNECTVGVDGEQLVGDVILVATGARPAVPAIPGLEKVRYLTNESAFELTELPASLLVVGGRYIALEIAQFFARLGTRVTVLQRSARILPDEAPALTNALTGYLTEDGIEIVTGVEALHASRDGGETVLETTVAGERRVFRAQRLLLATGRHPNTESLGLANVGVALDAKGFVRVDDTLATSTANVFAAGDVIGKSMFVYTAAYEGVLAVENAFSGMKRMRDYTALPWVVFTDPQVAGVGLDLRQAKARAFDAEAVTLPLSQVPRAIAARDMRGFIELIRDRQTDHLLGARILAPEGAELLMEIALTIRHRLTVREVRDAFHPYLTLSEGIKLAALSFGKDVRKLSCCAA